VANYDRILVLDDGKVNIVLILTYILVNSLLYWPIY